MSCFLYKITNTVNEKIYIGLTSRPTIRMKEHFYGKRSGNISLIKQAINKYGVDKFSFEVICEGTRDYIVDLEMKAIVLYDSINSGYNIRAGGEDHGSGHTFPIKVNDKPLYVTGFWFPNRRTCLDKLTIDPKSIYSWRKAGTLGDIQHLPKDAVSSLPVYVAGFWFDNYYRASDKLNQKNMTLKKRVREGFIEQKNNKTFKTGQDNHMTGRTGSLHHNSTPVIVDYIKYESIADAAKATGLTKKMIYTRLNKNIPGFSRIEEK